MDSFLLLLLATVFVATVLNVLLRRYDIPTVIGYILAGAIMSSAFKLEHRHGGSLEHLAEFGIVFLMFTIGLEFSIRHLRAMKREVFLYGFVQLMLAGNFFGMISQQLFGFDLKSSIIIGFSLALSSTAIVLTMLNERDELHSGYGRIVLGILLFQDLAVIPILLMISLFSSPEGSVAGLLVQTLVGMAVLLVVIFVVGNYLLERFLGWVLEADSEEIFLVAALMVVVGASYLAHLLGFSYSLGAFLAGMTLAETRYKYRIEADLSVFRDIFLGIFFVTIGMQIDPMVIWHNFGWILLLLVGVMAAKALLLFGALVFFTQKRTALKASLALMQVGEFALAIFALSVQEGLIESRINQILIVTVVLSMMLTPLVINRLKEIADRLYSHDESEPPPIVSSGYRNHVIVCGYGPMGQRLAGHLRERSLPYLIIEHDHRLVELARKREEPVILANAARRSVLRTAGIARARAVVVAIDNAVKTRQVVDAVCAEAPQVHTIVKVRNESQKRIIEGFGTIHVVDATEVVSQAIIRELDSCVLPTDPSR